MILSPDRCTKRFTASAPLIPEGLRLHECATLQVKQTRADSQRSLSLIRFVSTISSLFAEMPQNRCACTAEPVPKWLTCWRMQLSQLTNHVFVSDDQHPQSLNHRLPFCLPAGGLSDWFSLQSPVNQASVSAACCCAACTLQRKRESTFITTLGSARQGRTHFSLSTIRW